MKKKKSKKCKKNKKKKLIFKNLNFLEKKEDFTNIQNLQKKKELDLNRMNIFAFAKKTKHQKKC